jgi:hypothetical protein
MAITKSVIKLTHQEAYVKVINDTAGPASVTIDLDVDLKKTNETISGALDVRLSTVEYAVAAASKIVRNAVNVLQLPAQHGTFEHLTCNDATQSGQDLVVTMDQGTVVIRLLKVSGFLPNFRPAQGVNV